MSTNFTPNASASQSQITPEIAEAIKTARAASFRFEAEYFAFDWESRFEMAEELRGLLDELPDDLADATARVAEDLESDHEDFSDWGTRSAASRRMLSVAKALEAAATQPDGEPEEDEDAEPVMLAYPDDDESDPEDEDFLSAFVGHVEGEPADSGYYTDFPEQRAAFVHDYASDIEMEREKEVAY